MSEGDNRPVDGDVVCHLGPRIFSSCFTISDHVHPSKSHLMVQDGSFSPSPLLQAGERKGKAGKDLLLTKAGLVKRSYKFR